MIKVCSCCLLLIICCSFQVSAQRTVVSGRVTDADTEKPVPFVNIGFMHSLVGTISEMDGTFYLSVPSSARITDTLIFSSIGYEVERFFILKGAEQEFEVQLIPTSVMLEEVIITPGENPAFRILDRIIGRKKLNNPDRLGSYQYNAYTKLRLDMNNIDQKFKDQRFLRDFGFIFDYMDSSEVFNKNYLPVLISESTSRFYYSKNPPVQKEIIDAFRVSGIENNTVSQFSGKMYQKLNIYENFITFFDPGFVSPIADFGRLYYKYFLEDSSFIENSWCYKISFKPRRKQERTFYGYFWVADTSYAIKQFQLRVSADVNLNLVKDMIAINEYKKVCDSIWFLSSEDLTIDFNIAEKSYGFFGRKTAVYDQIRINKPLPDSILKINTDTYVREDNLFRREEFWLQNRKDTLTDEDRQVYAMVDSIKAVPAYRTLYGLGNMLASRYLVLGPVEFGPYYTLISSNRVEGTRVRLGGRTSNAFSTKIMLGGHAAYGFRDGKIKYGLYFNCMFNTNPRFTAGASYDHDIRQLGKSENAFLDDNFMTSLLRRRPNYKLSMVEQYKIFLEREWIQGFSNTVGFRYQTIFSTVHVPFLIVNSGIDSMVQESLSAAEITLSTHFAYREKFLLGKFERVSLGSKYPALDLDLTYGLKGLLKSSREYFKIQLQISDKIEINPLGYFKFRLTAGKIYGMLPYPLLKLHEGNETYAYDPMAFNMMNYYEFVSDEYINFFAEQHFQGFFLNRIPLIRKLHLREVAGCNILAGRLDNGHREVMEFPDGLYGLDKPYFEANAGIENIFKFVRVDALWRFSYLDHRDVRRFGIRVAMQFTF
ncbi:MAG: carboxypeptidase-like regulatory domain-containing protein [Bacteroidales bacterium]|nr:carboxypeptidase-like regulatory domain-containing protein [Bacteroidales bacterium]